MTSVGGGSRPEFVTHASVEAMSDAAARTVVEAARASVAARQRFVLLLSGGDSPRRTYELLATRYSGDIDWSVVEVFFSDERCVPESDPRNNFRLARDLLLSQVPAVMSRVHAIPSVGEPSALAARYDATLHQRFPGSGPAFDLAIMGMGADGHTASLFPQDAALHERARWAVAAHAPAGMDVRERITLTLPILNRARLSLFLVSGDRKRDAVARVRAGHEPLLPASLVHGIDRTLWLLDEKAAGDRPAH